MMSFNSQKASETEGQHDEIIKSSERNVSRNAISLKTADACLDWVIFPALLFIQFGATIFCQMKEGNATLDWKLVHSTILLFCIVAGLYRQILRQNSDSIAMLLLPEIFTNILLAMVMLVDTALAYATLVTLTAILIVVGSSFLFMVERHEQSGDYHQLCDEDDENEEEWIC